MKNRSLLIFLIIMFLFSFAGCKENNNTAQKEDINTLSDNKSVKTYKYSPASKEELKALVDNESISLADIDVSKITDMSELFKESERDDFTGIESWDVSNVDNMSGMFIGTTSFNQDIGKWNVSNMKYRNDMFNNFPLENNPSVWYK